MARERTENEYSLDLLRLGDTFAPEEKLYKEEGTGWTKEGKVG